MTPCATHPDAARGHRGRCLGCHNAQSQASRERRVAAGLPLTLPMTPEQRERKRAADNARYAANRASEQARHRDIYHAHAFARELAALVEGP